MRISDWSSDVCSSDLAIVQLVKSRTWERDVSIPCEVREPEAATSISYAENAQRVGMHPADSIRAFAALRDEGYGEEAIANRYRSEERRVGKECVRTCRSGGPPYH